jgi:hypothetical protein
MALGGSRADFGKLIADETGGQGNKARQYQAGLSGKAWRNLSYRAHRTSAVADLRSAKRAADNDGGTA